MLLPVIERFAELGWQAFVEPGETYELFSVSGIFKRAHIDTQASASDGAQHLVQRNALFDVCLSSGLAHLIVGYVRATVVSSATSVSLSQANVGAGVVGGRQYVLKEPIAVQQWLRRRIESLEKIVHAEVAGYNTKNSTSTTPTDAHKRHSHHNHHQQKTGESGAESHVRELSGLRAVAVALVERLKEGARQLEADAHALRARQSSTAPARADDTLKQTELARLTNEGIQTLLEVLFRVQSAMLTYQCLQWFKERNIVFDADQYHEFYYQARSARASLRQSFEGAYEVVLSSISNSDIAFPSLLIELVMQNANVAQQLSLPPSNISELLKLLQSPTVHEEMVLAYADEVSHEPVEVIFRVSKALLLYFALDLAYVSVSEARKHTHQQGWTGAELVDHFVDIAESFAAQMGVPDDMKATLLAIWLIENAVNVRLSSNDEVAPIYHGAVTRLLESSAMHLQRKAGLEAELILYMIETLVHRGESSFAWKIWTAFDMELSALPPVATEYAVMVNLELSAWERALSLIRHQRRLDLLELVFKWLVKSNRMKELVHYTTLATDEEALYDEFMMGGRFLGDAALQEGSIRKADLLVMYYVLRNQFDKAWAVHHEHLALIRQSSSGNTNVALAVLHQPSFRIRTALLQNMKAEPAKPTQDRSYNFKRAFKPTHPLDADMIMIGSSGLPVLQLPEPSASEDDEQMLDDLPFLPSAPTSSVPMLVPPSSTPQGQAQMPSSTEPSPGAATWTPDNASFSYSPGIYSSRSSQPRSSSKKSSSEASSSPFVEDAATTPVTRGTRRNVPIGSIDSSPAEAAQVGAFRRQPLDGSTKRVAPQALNFGFSPVAPRGSGAAKSNGSNGQESDHARSFVSQPVRSAFNSAFASFPPRARGTSNEDLSLKPRAVAPVDSTPVDVQVGSTIRVGGDGSDQAAMLSSSIAAAASTSSHDLALFETPQRFHFVREPQTDSRIMTKPRDFQRSPATMELEAMELEPIDEEFNTPSARDRAAGAVRRKEPQSAPSRRNPRRNSRTMY